MSGPRITGIEVSVYKIPTTSPESDGTLEWDSTTLVLVRMAAGNSTGLGFTYASQSTATLIEKTLVPLVIGADSFDLPRLWIEMQTAIRGTGRAGVSAMAISGMDIALWDLKAKLMGLPILDLLGAARHRVEAYGSGGFTSYSDEQLREQFSGWAQAGLPAVKMKIGRNPGDDVRRVKLAREIIGPKCRLFVDANGAYRRKQALDFAERVREMDVCWFEEPVSSDDLEGLRFLRDRGPAGMEIAAGEYGYDSVYFRRMLEQQAVDVLQADGTRCGGVTGFFLAASLADGFEIALSAHTAPSLHAYLACVATRAINVEYFHDHAVIEKRFLEGAIEPRGGFLEPGGSEPGFGWEFKSADARQYRVI